MSYRQIFYHIVFGTKHRKATIADENCEQLYKYNYIKSQKEHHKKETFRDEFRRLLMENDIECNEKYLL